MNSQYKKLTTLLKELFQLDQPDLDFGIYRVLHARAAEISHFLDVDFLPQVRAALREHRSAEKTSLERKLSKLVAGIDAAGMNPEDSPKVEELRDQLKDDAMDIDALEREIYDHLFRFFRRYYSDGDYLAKRVYKPGVYAIPYEGQEVALHWANKDQYYIKTNEYLRNYIFRVLDGSENEASSMRVHFRLADAAEGEHGNIKAVEAKKRVFVLAEAGDSGYDFITEEEHAHGRELIIHFTYRPPTLRDWPEHERIDKKRPPSQKVLNKLACEYILAALNLAFADWVPLLDTPHVMASGEPADYSRLTAHIERYTARNTFDYFIHRDLGSFLRQELDFYIKNEVLQLDDVEHESESRVEQYLSKIRIIRRIARKIIGFLAQLEDFQRKLWLKKKFVVETQYCITLGLIPEAFFPEIAANGAQRDEWIELFALTEMEPDLANPIPFSDPPSLEFLRANPSLPVHTKHFSTDFTARLLDNYSDLSEVVQGTLIHAENFQALRLLQRRLTGEVDFAYIDPPYNTGQDEFLYKDNYQHSSWLSMVADRLRLLLPLLAEDAVFACSLNDDETYRAGVLLDTFSPRLSRLGEFVWRTRNTDNRVLTRLSVDHEYIHVFAGPRGRLQGRVIDRSDFKNPDEDPRGPYTTDPLTGKANAQNRPNLHYVIANPDTGDEYPPHPDSGWITDRAGFIDLLDDKRIYWPKDATSGNPRKKRFLSETAERAPVSSLEIKIKQGEGNRDLARLFGEKLLNFPKPVSVMETVVDVCSPPNGLIMDFFAGSGTTGEAVVRLNRDKDCTRRFLLVEMGYYFDSLCLPRILKTIGAAHWDAGKPVALDGSGRAGLSYVRLESYEDTLNNLEMSRSDRQQLLLDAAEAQGTDGLKEEYTLRYMLDLEARGSQSLLNMGALSDPTAYKLKVTQAGTGESREVDVDLLETFNWLIGLTVRHIAAGQTFSAVFERDGEKRLRLKKRLKQDLGGPYWFRTVAGTTPDGRKTLVIWRKLTGDSEKDNLVLDEWFTKQDFSCKDGEFNLIYVNGDNNLENLRTPGDRWKARLIEDDFWRLMFDMEGA